MLTQEAMALDRQLQLEQHGCSCSSSVAVGVTFQQSGWLLPDG